MMWQHYIYFGAAILSLPEQMWVVFIFKHNYEYAKLPLVRSRFVTWSLNLADIFLHFSDSMCHWLRTLFSIYITCGYFDRSPCFVSFGRILKQLFSNLLLSLLSYAELVSSAVLVKRENDVWMCEYVVTIKDNRVKSGWFGWWWSVRQSEPNLFRFLWV